MSVRFETYLTEQQVFFVHRSLMRTIESMQSLLRDLHRENARWHSEETDALLTQDEAEIVALQAMVDALTKLQEAQGWRNGVDVEKANELPVE